MDEWKELWDNDRLDLQRPFEELLRTNKVLLDGYTSGEEKLETAVLLQSELESSGGVDEQQRIKAVLDRFLRVTSIEDPVVPMWFVSRDDVGFHSWSIVMPSSVDQHVTLHEGEWCKTSVMIETSARCGLARRNCVNMVQMSLW